MSYIIIFLKNLKTFQIKTNEHISAVVTAIEIFYIQRKQNTCNMTGCL